MQNKDRFFKTIASVALDKRLLTKAIFSTNNTNKQRHKVAMKPIRQTIALCTRVVVFSSDRRRMNRVNQKICLVDFI